MKNLNLNIRMVKKEIAILATYVGMTERGTETFVIEFTKRLRNDFNITVFASGISEDIKDNIIKVEIGKSICLNFHKKLYESINLYRKICNRIYYLIPSEIEQYNFSKKVYKDYLLKRKYDLIFPNNGIQGIRYADKIRQRNLTPFMYTGHGGSSKGEILILKHKPDMYIALTERYLKMMKRYYERIVKIHNGIYAGRFNVNFETRKEHLCLKHPIVLCVGAFTEMKRQRLLIDAMMLVKDGFLILLGDGEDKEKLENYCSEKIPGRYLITKISRNEIPYYYSLCDVFSLPSKDEPFGIVYLEAMASNKPIVTTKDEDREEIVGNSGILCDVENPQEYSNAILRCYNKKWGNIPRDRVISNFNWDKVLKEYEKVIEKITS